MPRSANALALVIVMLLPAACGKQTTERCTPGESKACVCTDGKAGAQTCSPDGTGLGTCTCATGPVVSPTAAPVVPAVPATVPTSADPSVPRATYTTTLGPLDHVNSKGVKLGDAAGILRQDRARVQGGHGDPGDDADLILVKDDDRNQFEVLARKSALKSRCSCLKKLTLS